MQRLQVKFKSFDREILDPDITNKADRRDSLQMLKKQDVLEKMLGSQACEAEGELAIAHCLLLWHCVTVM